MVFDMIRCICKRVTQPLRRTRRKVEPHNEGGKARCLSFSLLQWGCLLSFAILISSPDAGVGRPQPDASFPVVSAGCVRMIQ